MTVSIETEKSTKPVANFAKKENVEIPVDILGEMRIVIPPIYYWEDVVLGQSTKMTMAFKILGSVYGLSYPIEEDNAVKINIARKKLFNTVKESLDVLVHHGKKVLDSFGNINPRLVNDEEAIRYKFDQLWNKRVVAFNKLVRIKPITRKEALKLGLLK